MSSDKIEKFHNSIIQHGPLNQRIYLMHLSPDDYPQIIPDLKNFALQHGYTKIFAKVPCNLSSHFTEAGYMKEAHVPGMYQGRNDGCFMGLFLDEMRMIPYNAELMRQVLQAATDRKAKPLTNQPPPNYKVRQLGPDDAQNMAEVYSQTFETYPFPVFNPDYLVQTMQENISYFGIFADSNLVALSSAETDQEAGAAEVTDFATLMSYRGQRLGRVLIHSMLQSMKQEKILTLYSIARSVSYGMNITLARSGFRFTGVLINNTHIAGNMESMNVWYLSL
ncbi:putative beta-lysine N-acetyltransferase [Desulfonatronovibrio magnus]|uniref:putative beta-lysine N-acetyltransferase n=1 Tax=Desulfonatronovibrio magnus TaxID=698827 RepID=UPI0005EB20B1|nr:putative beta-lysine N-acetyltransferase [Desulfonatronovibrio magnus]